MSLAVPRLPQGPGKAEGERLINVRRPNGDLAFRATEAQAHEIVTSGLGAADYSATGKLRFVALFRREPDSVIATLQELKRIPMVGDAHKLYACGGADNRTCGKGGGASAANQPQQGAHSSRAAVSEAAWSLRPRR